MSLSQERSANQIVLVKLQQLKTESEICVNKRIYL